MKHILEGYVHNPGKHCASTAISDVMNFEGIDLDEAMCLGLGCGLGFAYFHIEQSSPSHITATRSAFLEPRFFENIGVPFEWIIENDKNRAMRKMEEAILAGQPVLMKSDIKFLHYYNTKQSFPGHVISIWGFDDEKKIVYVADTQFPGLCEAPYEDFIKGRYSSAPWAKLSGDYFPVEASGHEFDLASAIKKALKTQADDMLSDNAMFPGIVGMEGLKNCRKALPSFADAKDWQWSARWFYQVIEKRGSGGGAFRALYADFLEQAEKTVPSFAKIAPPSKMKEIAANWTELALKLKEISDRDGPDGFGKAADMLDEIIEKETTFFTAVLDQLE